MNNIYLCQIALGLSCLFIIQLGTENIANSGTYVYMFFKLRKKAVFVDVVMKRFRQFAQNLLRYL